MWTSWGCYHGTRYPPTVLITKHRAHVRGTPWGKSPSPPEKRTPCHRSEAVQEQLQKKPKVLLWPPSYSDLNLSISWHLFTNLLYRGNTQEPKNPPPEDLVLAVREAPTHEAGGFNVVADSHISGAKIKRIYYTSREVITCIIWDIREYSIVSLKETETTNKQKKDTKQWEPSNTPVAKT